MKMIRLAAALASLAVALPGTAGAQQTPEQAAERFLQTLKAQDWAANATLMDAAELDSMKAAFLEVTSTDTSTAGLRAVFGVGSGAELRGLTPAVVYQRFATNVIGQRPGMSQFLAAATFRVMGRVQEGDTAYVVYRVSSTPAAGSNIPALNQVSVVTTRRTGGVWKVRLNDEIQGMLAGLRSAAAQRRAASAAIEQARRDVANPAPPSAPPAGPVRPAPPPAPARP
ncbi:MAG TPA: hypothetical protein VEX86_24120 [Longimicrobium sp.]|nr:hypothetical protein [Longimicrobium sp.]